jgi:hypothetical protein
MTVDNPRLMAILGIGHDTSIRGEGLSLRDALARTEYSALRAEFGPADLVPLLRANPEFISQWLMYCEDKRTAGSGWMKPRYESDRSKPRIRLRDTTLSRV